MVCARCVYESDSHLTFLLCFSVFCITLTQNSSKTVFSGKAMQMFLLRGRFPSASASASGSTSSSVAGSSSSSALFSAPNVMPLIHPLDMVFSLHIATLSSPLVPSLQLKGVFEDVHCSLTSKNYRAYVLVVLWCGVVWCGVVWCWVVLGCRLN